MPTEEELLAAIHTHPDDDAPRLAHADWLGKNGDPDRAEFIRLQVSLAARPFTGPTDQRGARFLALKRDHSRRWLGDRPQERGVVWDFERGYPEVVTFTSLTAFRKSWRKALSFPVRWVAFDGLTGTSGLAECPGLAEVRRLAMGCYSIDE